MNDDAERVDAEIQRFYDAIGALAAPADPAPEAVTEFARTPETRQALSDVLPPDELAALDQELELYEALADFDLTGDDPELTPVEKRRAMIEAWHTARKPDHRRNQETGHTAQFFDDVDEHRRGAGRADYNANKKKKRHADAEAAGRTFRPRAPRGQTSPDAKSNAERQAAFRMKERQEAKALGISVKEYKRRKTDAKRSATF